MVICSNLALVRADVCRLPFASGFVDAVHAGAALHCWPSPSNAASVFSSSYSLLSICYLLQFRYAKIIELDNDNLILHPRRGQVNNSGQEPGTAVFFEGVVLETYS